MIQLSKEELEELTSTIAGRIKEFEVPDAALPTRGIIRIAYEVITEFLRQQRITLIADKNYAEIEETRDVMRKAGLEHAVAKVNQVSSERVVATLGPEHTLVTPLRSQADDSVATDKRQADFDAIIKELKHLAMGGFMPSMATWDTSRLASLPKAHAAIGRFQKGWAELADIAGLKMGKRGPAKDERVHINGTWNGDA